ncbi:hypothetical protein HTZ97_16355 [Desulfuromonas acetoxidans]|uniref:Uncharacterized protein n=1 Tax=Desulfuromonas acetoxidans (strain DSM 684 / 11070) TaxID=281689 RepID=Q1K074_DESA6|nr:hypothetical protein [Desulfuromonas acetoxidans]EAT16067.1 hypothetical protein Dace_2368 [Desulfuromonas acetoxidans DSM 684]MBF0646882.1 hypothetical protein [Desulfuromonas acetoxidans]NVD26159.1 hypothetical protein [Desulfuromonas acetoxidans]NVE18029.1 hypothetical protein [Desulfuromonas acetoxidans]
MSKYLEIRNDIRDRLKDVEGIGVVHGYSRYTTNMSQYIKAFLDKTSSRINGWEISRKRVPESLGTAFFREHHFILRGFLGLNDADATDELFQVKIDDVCDLYRQAQPPQGATWLYRPIPDSGESCVQVPVIDERLFGAVLCHYCEINLVVTERINPTLL